MEKAGIEDFYKQSQNASVLISQIYTKYSLFTRKKIGCNQPLKVLMLKKNIYNENT